MSCDELNLQSLLATDGRIVDEDDTHAVIALRIPKSLIERNLPLLSALAELTTRRPARPRPCHERRLPKFPGWG